MVWPIMRSFSGRDFAAEFVEETEDEADFVNWRWCCFAVASFQHGESFAVSVQSKVGRVPAAFWTTFKRKSLHRAGWPLPRPGGVSVVTPWWIFGHP